MSQNPETLRLYARIMEIPRRGEYVRKDFPDGHHSYETVATPGEISKACAAALRFQADAIEGCRCSCVAECEGQAGCQIAKAQQPHICHCDLSGDLHVVTFEPRTCCEVCQVGDTELFTPENVNKAFKHLGEQISAHNAKVDAAVVDLSATMEDKR